MRITTSFTPVNVSCVRALHTTHVIVAFYGNCGGPFFNTNTFFFVFLVPFFFFFFSFLRGEQVRVDHVWVKVQAAASSGNSAACVRELTLLPRNMDSRRWCDDFQLSDHRPLYTCIDIDIASSQ